MRLRALALAIVVSGGVLPAGTFFLPGGAGLAGAALAQAATVASPILILDRDRLFAETLYGQRLISEGNAAYEEKAGETAKIEAGLEAEERELTDKRATMEATEFRALADAFDEKVQALRADRAAADAALASQQETAQQEFFARVGPVLGGLVRERGAVMIIDRRAVLLSATVVDITDASIARIDAVLGDGTAPAEATGTETGTGTGAAQEGAADGLDGLDVIPAPDPVTDPPAAAAEDGAALDTSAAPAPQSEDPQDQTGTAGSN